MRRKSVGERASKQEIERKFLTCSDAWRNEENRVLIRQGYLRADPLGSIRVRLVDDHAVLTLKGPCSGIRRAEIEYPIARTDAELLLDQLLVGRMVEKWRTRISHAGHIWEVDEFLGENEGLVVAEIELNEEEEPFEMPLWAGSEVTQDPRFLNASLALHPYSEWNPS